MRRDRPRPRAHRSVDGQAEGLRVSERIVEVRATSVGVRRVTRRRGALPGRRRRLVGRNVGYGKHRIRRGPGDGKTYASEVAQRPHLGEAARVGPRGRVEKTVDLQRTREPHAQAERRPTRRLRDLTSRGLTSDAARRRDLNPSRVGVFGSIRRQRPDQRRGSRQRPTYPPPAATGAARSRRAQRTSRGRQPRTEALSTLGSPSMVAAVRPLQSHCCSREDRHRAHASHPVTTRVTGTPACRRASAGLRAISSSPFRLCPRPSRRPALQLFGTGPCWFGRAADLSEEVVLPAFRGTQPN